MASPVPDTYHVAMKAFVRKGRSVLLCKDRLSGRWDLPGGRIAIGEFRMPLEEILKREIAEELGPHVQYRNKGPAAIFRHRRPEFITRGREIKILMIGFDLQYLGGKILLSDEHTAYRWFPLGRAAGHLPGGQADGMRKYLTYLRKKKLVC